MEQHCRNKYPQCASAIKRIGRQVLLSPVELTPANTSLRQLQFPGINSAETCIPAHSNYNDSSSIISRLLTTRHKEIP